MKIKHHKIVLTFALSATAVAAMGAEESTSSSYLPNLFENMILFTGVAIVVASLLGLLSAYSSLTRRMESDLRAANGLEAEAPKKTALWTRLNRMFISDAVPVAEEDDILMHHNFDGIRELDNNLPPWWKWMFYLTIGFAVVYITHFHIAELPIAKPFLGPAVNPQEAYAMEMEQAERDMIAYLANQPDQVDETNVTILTDQMEVDAGKRIYDANCIACHGALGEGGTGPNLTDNYWLHGGDVKDVFKTIKYGVQEKGMQSWKSMLRATEIQQVTSYIHSIAGTNPPGAKEPQGEEYIPEVAAEQTTDGPAEEAAPEQEPIKAGM